jgi:hypothetical protein
MWVEDHASPPFTLCRRDWTSVRETLFWRERDWLPGHPVGVQYR